MLCPVCGGSKLKHGSHLVPYTYKGRKTVFSLVGDKCPVCERSPWTARNVRLWTE